MNPKTMRALVFSEQGAAAEEIASTGRVVYIGYAGEPAAYETKRFVQKAVSALLSSALRGPRTVL